jgi:uncharacterized XkdX family phage protein
MSNPIILRRIKALYASGSITTEAVLRYVAAGLITQEEADEIIGGNE